MRGKKKCPDFQWTDKAVALVKERYQIDGPKKLAELLGTTRAAVNIKSRRLGIKPKNGGNHEPWEWTEKELDILKERYPTDDIRELAKQMGIPKYVLQGKARKLGIKNVTGRERAAKAKAENNRSCDVHYFDKWSENMAWCLGFCFSDASITKRLENYLLDKGIPV